MKKIIDTKNVQYTQYDDKCPFDTAKSIINWLDGIDSSNIRQVSNQFLSHNCLNDFGKEVDEAINLIRGFRATNEGIPEKTLAFYKRYDAWFEKNKKATNIPYDSHLIV